MSEANEHWAELCHQMDRLIGGEITAEEWLAHVNAHTQWTTSRRADSLPYRRGETDRNKVL